MSSTVRLGRFAAVWMATGFVGGCAAYRPISPELRKSSLAPLERLLVADDLAVAFETQPACKLERAQDGGEAPGEGWEAIKPNELSGKVLHVEARGVQGDPKEADPPFSLALRVSNKQGDRFWLRNQPVRSVSDAVSALRCLADVRLAETRKSKLNAKVVRLDTSTGRCPALTPIIGTRDDVSIAPYTIVSYGFFAGRPPSGVEASRGDPGPLDIGATMEAEGGEKRLILPVPVLDRCFTPADRPPPLPGETRKFLEWLTGEKPDTKIPPTVSSETVEAVAGVSLDHCKRDGRGATAHYECRAPVLRVTPAFDPGPFGPKLLQLTRERLVDAMHLYAGKLVSPTEVVEVNAAVRTPKLAPSSTFARTFQATLAKSVDNPQAKVSRGAHGFRLLRQSEGFAGVQPTHYVDLDLAFNVPEIETTTETRNHHYIAGKKQVPNPAYDKAVEEVENATAGLESAKQAAEAAKAAAEAAKQACSQLSGIAALGCSATAGVAGAGISAGAIGSAQTRLGQARANLATTPKELTVDDERDWQYQAKILRRKGEATAQLSIAPAGRAGAPQFTATIKIPFEAVDVEVPDDPAHKLVGKKASPPSPEDVEKTLAESLIPKIDDAIVKWGAQRQVGGDLGDMLPGTRSWMVGVARRAADDRPVKLLSDVLENREDELALPLIVRTVKMPANAAERCFTFAAIPLDGRADVNLQFGVPPPPGSKRFLAIGKDHRSDPDAAFEVCNVPAGTYAIGVSFGPGGSSKEGVLMSMFDSTPKGATNEDTRAATRGIPTMPGKGERLELNGDGVVEFDKKKNTITRPPKPGDRDGDGVLDDDDRCPYDSETFNAYLDNDGCPDEPPPGFSPPDGWQPPGEKGASSPPVPAAPPAPSGAPPKAVEPAGKRKPGTAPAPPRPSGGAGGPR